MDPIEKAIRAAFEKGDTSQRAYREKVYRSAFAALDRALQANPKLTPEIAQRRRQELSAKISQIESQFIPAVPTIEPVRTAPAAPAAQAPEISVGWREPEFTAAAPVEAPRVDSHAGPEADRRPEPIAAPVRGDRPPRVRRSWIAPLVALVVFAAFVGGVYSFLGSGQVRLPDPQTTAPVSSRPAEQTSTPPPALGSEEPLADWITIFSPNDPTTVSAPGDTQAEVDEEDGRSFIRIASGASGSPILFDVGQGILDQLSGRKVVFAIVAKSADGEETQMAVECSLAALGDCGRKRFITGETREDFLFEVELPNANPGSGGIISINPDIEGQGRAVEIHEIRVTPSGPAG